MQDLQTMYNRSVGNLEDFDSVPILWVNEFTFETSISFSTSIAELDSDDAIKEIFVYVSSYGGEAMPLLGMVDSMLSCRKPVHSVVSGMAASCGAILAMCAPGNRIITPSSSLLIHHVRGSIREDLPGMEQEIKAMNQVESKLFKMIAKRSGITVTKLRNKLKEEKREWSCSAQEALDFGLVDIIGTPRINANINIDYEIK